VAPGKPREDEVVRPGEAVALEQPRERGRNLGGHRHRSPLARLRLGQRAVSEAPDDVDRLPLKVDLANTQGA
jgi:hypothetical protein